MWGSVIALFFCIIIALTKNYTVFVHSPKTYGNFDYKNFVVSLLLLADIITMNADVS